MKNLLDVTEVTVFYESEVSRLRREAKVHATSVNADVVAFVNGTILTMENGDQLDDLIQEGTVILRGGFIEAVGKHDDIAVPDGSLVIQANGGKAFVLCDVGGCIDNMHRRVRLYHPWLHRRTRALGWDRDNVSCYILGDANIPCIRCHYGTQVSIVTFLLVLQPNLSAL